MCKFECKVTTFSVMPQVRLEKKRCSSLTDNILFITLRPYKQKRTHELATTHFQ